MVRHSLAILLLAVPAFAQAPSEHWKTITTPHFRLHYPAQYEAWTMRAASHIESVRDAVVREVGYSPKTMTDILVMNPIADPNGATLPLLGHPRILLFTEPPDPATAIGEFSNWIDLLTVHEMTHLVHLLRPSRNPLQRFVEHALPLNPITLGAPRWVLEGYATVVEGRITGYGRPSSSIRAAILRKWAASGRLPAYSQLDSDRRYLGMSMAYLAGSAYLEWLEQRGGPDALKHLWARMTARQKRSFDSAFIGVFGETPERLYGLFTAELTQRAVDLAQTHGTAEGELWLETKRGSGDPAVSPDGSQIALVERNEKGEAKLVVYSTGPNTEEKKLDEKIAKILKRDPEDVGPVRTKPVARKAVHALRPRDGGDVESPRWSGASIVYTHKQPDRDGFLHNDLFVWTPATRTNRRLTHLADVEDADPSGGWAIAVRNRFGFSQLVKVDLATGAVSEFTPPSLDRSDSHPRVSKDGHIAWAEHDATGWHIVVDGERRGDGYEPEWGPDGALYSVVAAGGFIDVMRNGEPVTRMLGAASDPAPAPDGSLYFMSLETTGYELRHVGTGFSRPNDQSNDDRLKPVRTQDFVPALPPPRATPTVFVSGPTSAPRSYGIGRQELGLAFGGAWTAYDHSNEIGARLGDVVGRLDTIAMLASGRDRGAALASTWRGWPVAITAHAFKIPEKHGVELRGEYQAFAPGTAAYFEAGASSRAFGVAALSLRQRQTSESLRMAADSTRHALASVAGSVRAGDLRLRLTAEAGRRLSIGGFTASTVPDSLRIERVDDPALPAEFAFAERYRSARLDVVTGAVTVFWRRYDLLRDVDVRGVEVSLAAPPVALLKLAGFHLTAGVAKITRVRGVKGWLALRWRP